MDITQQIEVKSIIGRTTKAARESLDRLACLYRWAKSSKPSDSKLKLLKTILESKSEYNDFKIKSIESPKH